MIRKILVGLDGSRDGDRAVEQGIRWARLTGAELTGVGVVDEPTICRPEPVGAWGASLKERRDATLLADARTRVHGFVSRFADRCRAAGVRHHELTETGLPSEKLLDLTPDVDLTVLGRETHFQFETQDEADRTLEKVVRGSERPVVAVPDVVNHGRPVVVAYDASPAAVRALESFAESGLDEGRPVRVVSVAPDAIAARLLAEDATRYLTHFRIRTEAVPLTGRNATNILVEKIRSEKPAFVVMGAFGGPRRFQFFRRSTTHRMLREAGVPLFLHP
jgi:nucleotide-binding universal stress UspA family protein